MAGVNVMLKRCHDMRPTKRGRWLHVMMSLAETYFAWIFPCALHMGWVIANDVVHANDVVLGCLFRRMHSA